MPTAPGRCAWLLDRPTRRVALARVLAATKKGLFDRERCPDDDRARLIATLRELLTLADLAKADRRRAERVLKLLGAE